MKNKTAVFILLLLLLAVPACSKSGAAQVSDSVSDFASTGDDASGGVSDFASSGDDISEADPEASDSNEPDTPQSSGDESAGSINIEVRGSGETTYLTARLAGNSSAEALMALLEDGPVTIEMSDYGGFEKVGPLGFQLPANDEQTATLPGDLILYQGSYFVMYYGENNWSFTRLGRINDATRDELTAAFGSGDITVVLSVEG